MRITYGPQSFVSRTFFSKSLQALQIHMPPQPSCSCNLVWGEPYLAATPDQPLQISRNKYHSFADKAVTQSPPF